MTAYKTPPNQHNLTLKNGDTLLVTNTFQSDHITIDNGGTETVQNGGTAKNTTINDGILNVDHGGIATDTQLNFAGSELNVHGTAKNTTIKSGTEHVFSDGLANGVKFQQGEFPATLALANPSDLTGYITGWNISHGFSKEQIDFLNISAIKPVYNPDSSTLTVNYGAGFSQHATYLLADLAPNAKFATKSDGNGGTDVYLVPAKGVGTPDAELIGVQHDTADHHLL
jgi:autotransporter passenger strand-loop-strand repeat protein